MSSHYESSHYASSHYGSSHFGRTGVAPPVIEEVGAGAPRKRKRPAEPHGVYIPVVKLPDSKTVENFDDETMAMLSVILIEEFYSDG